MNQTPKGPQGPRRYPGQNEAAQKQRDIMQAAKKDELAKKMREAYENFQKSPEADTVGMKSGGMPDLTGDGKVTRADVLKGRGVFKKGGAVKSSASKRADGCAVKGKTRGKIV
jgi:hypothetical protein